MPGGMINNCGDGVLAFGIRVLEEEGVEMFELIHPVSDSGQIHGEEGGWVIRFGPLDSEVDGDKEGKTPIQKAGGGPVVPHKG